jgi:hypothetical protein
MATTEDGVLRFEARLVAVERRSQAATITFSVPVGKDADALASKQGETVLLGVLFEREPTET